MDHPVGSPLVMLQVEEQGEEKNIVLFEKKHEFLTIFWKKIIRFSNILEMKCGDIGEFLIVLRIYF